MSVSFGVVGATGVVGDVVLKILSERKFPVGQLRLFASSRSAGQKVEYNGAEIIIEDLEASDFSGLDIVISSIDSAITKKWIPKIVEAGAIVIDNSSAYRQDPAVPLVIPEINGHAISGHAGIIANPNCTTATILMALAPLHLAAGIRSIISSSYQSVSGTGKDAVAELLGQVPKAMDQIDGLFGYAPLDLPAPVVYRHPLAFNLIPQCETFPPDGDTSTEESKMAAETRKILASPEIVVHATAVRVPVIVGHSAALSVSLQRPVEPSEARELIDAFDGARVVDKPDQAQYPTPQQSAGIDDVLVGRIRSNPALENGLSLFVCGDNLRKGAALNAVQIAEKLIS